MLKILTIFSIEKIFKSKKRKYWSVSACSHSHLRIPWDNTPISHYTFKSQNSQQTATTSNLTTQFSKHTA